MLRRLLIAAALIFSAAAAQAQKTPSVIQGEINTRITTNGVGAISGAILNGVLLDMATSYGGTLAANTWAQPQTFSVNPVLSACSGVLSGNSGNAVSCLPLTAYAIPCNFSNVTATATACTSIAQTHYYLTDILGNVTGAYFEPENHVSWTTLRQSILDNGQELNIYARDEHGLATAAGGTNTITYVSGSAFNSAWVGRSLFYFNGVQYQVASVSGTTLTVNTPAGGATTVPAATSKTFQFIGETTDSVCNVSGSAVTWVSGQAFNSNMGAGTGGSFSINGTPYTISSVNSTTSLTLSTSAGALTNAACHADSNVYDEVTALIVQKVWGANEENLHIMSRAGNGNHGLAGSEYRVSVQHSGSGTYWPLVLGSGKSVDLHNNIVLNADGTSSIGGYPGYEVLQVDTNNLIVATNSIFVKMAPAGSAPGFVTQAGTADTDVGMVFGSVGAGDFDFISAYAGTSHRELKVVALGRADAIEVGSGTTGFSTPPLISVYGADTNVSIRIVPKGNGTVLVPAITANGSAPTASGSCSVNTQTGGNTAGTFKANGACAAGTVILTFATTQPTGWVCDTHDQTTVADLMNQTANTTTSVTFSGNMAANDVVAFKCMGF